MVRQKKRRADDVLSTTDDVKITGKKAKMSESTCYQTKQNSDTNDLSGPEECQPKKRGPQRRSARSNKVTPSERKTKNAKVKKTATKMADKDENCDSENELSSFNSTDSGISSETNLLLEKRKPQKVHSKKTGMNNITTSVTVDDPAKSKSVRVGAKKCKISETKPILTKTKNTVPKIEIKDEICDSETNFLVSMDRDMSKEKPDSLKNVGVESRIDGDSSSSESEWEEVEQDAEQKLADYKPEIPKEGVEITIDCPELNMRKRKKKQFDEMEYIRLYINRGRKEAQLNIHKTHLLCLLAQGLYVNNVLNSPILKAMALSLIPADILSITSGKKVDKIDSDGIERIAKWFRSSFTYETENDLFINVSQSLIRYFENKKALNSSEYNLMFVVIARTLGFKTRFCTSLYPITYKAQNLIKKPNSKRTTKTKVSSSPEKEKKNETIVKAGPSKSKTKKKDAFKVENETKLDSAIKKEIISDLKSEKPVRSKRSTKKSYKMSSDESGDDLKDEDFHAVASDSDDFVEPKISRRSSAKTPQKKSNRKVLSTDSEPSSPEPSNYKSDRIICWAEVFSKPDKQWISVECVNNLVNKPYEIEAITLQPVTYILSFDNGSYVKDVTRRYCSEYMTSTIKLRPDTEWWEESLEPFLPPNSKLDKEEENNLDNMLVNKPLPTTVAGFKNHPLYALKRHLLKFEAIYPPDAPSIGFLRGEPVYARDCVAHLHSRETWLKEARVVRIGEEPYKIVKARPKWDKIAGVLRTDLPLEVFGFWQTEPYEPPIAVDGKVPRNEYGNVELFKPCMLPKGTVHLQIPGLNRIARKLGIDCCGAVVGFDGHKGSIHPVFDGFVICEEFKDTILAAWEEEQVNARKREEEKREKRIYGNWKKLIRGLLIKERIKLKYDTK